MLCRINDEYDFNAVCTKFAGEGQWNKVAIALVNGGGIRASIDENAQNGWFICLISI